MLAARTSYSDHQPHVTLFGGPATRLAPLMRETPASSRPDYRRILGGIALAFFAVILLRTAWLSDTSYLTLRTAEHAAGGFGLRWNITERVQVYDHPLWLILLIGGRLLTGELYFTSLAMSMVASFGAAWVILRQAATEHAVVLAGVLVCLSPVFVTFSTSGLELPLLHLLVGAAAVCLLGSPDAQRSAIAFAALTALAALTHWTALLCLFPGLLMLVARSPARRRLWLLAFGVAPLVAFSAWSVWYYGANGSNAWIAEQHADVRWTERLDAGISFLVETGREDPLLVSVLIAGVTVGFTGGLPQRLLALGALLFTTWITVSGASWMAGRGLSVPFVIAALLLVRRLSSAPAAVTGLAAAGAVVLATQAPSPTYSTDSSHGSSFRRTARVHDARAEDYQATGLLLVSRPRMVPDHPEARRARDQVATGARVGSSRKPGFFGMAAGPETYVFDPRGFVDPLLARLPPAVGSRWLWGSERRIPAGYVESLPDEPIALEEPALTSLYTDLRRVTRGPTGHAGRLGDILRLPSGARALVRSSSYGPEYVELRQLPRADAGSSQRSIPELGTIVTFGERRGIRRIGVDLSQGYDYEVEVLDGEAVLLTLLLPRVGWQVQGASTRRIRLDEREEATALRFECRRGFGPCTLGGLTIAD